jgi:hypothetical protein
MRAFLKAVRAAPLYSRTSGEALAGLDASVSVAGLPPALLAGIRHPVRIEIQNTGSHPFDPVGPELRSYRLGVRSRIADVDLGRVDLPAPLAAGESVSLTVDLALPETSGRYELELRMLLEHVSWFGRPSDPAVIDVVAPVAEIVGVELPGSMVLGHRYGGIVYVRNTGPVSWSLVGPRLEAFRVGVAEPTPETWGAIVRADFTEPVAPGETAAAYLTIVATGEPGSYSVQWRCVQEGVSWFGATSAPLTVEIVDPQPPLWDEDPAAFFEPDVPGEPQIPIVADVERVLQSHWRHLLTRRIDVVP